MESRKLVLLQLAVVLTLCSTSLGQSVTTVASSVNPALQLITGINPPKIIPALNCPICECGVSNGNQRIVGGTVIDVTNKYPWLAAIFSKNHFTCGGSLITDRHVITAGHCMIALDLVLTVVYLMEYSIANQTDTNAIKARLKWAYLHPNYNDFDNTNDLSVLLLDTVLTWSNKLRPICMPTQGETYAGYTGIAAGWGDTQEGGPQSTVPREVTLPIMSNAYCRANTSYKDIGMSITDDMMCAGYLAGGKDPCQGDSGGPLVVQNPAILTRKVYQLVGSVSFGEGCGRAGFPGVYSRITYNNKWIREVTIDGCYCPKPLV